MKNTVWTNEEDSFLLECYTQGLPFEEIANTLGRTAKACSVRMAILRNGTSLDLPEDMRIKLKESREVRAEVQAKQSDLKSARRNKEWTGKEIETMIELKAQGMSNKAIAQQLGRTDKSVAGKANKLRHKGMNIGAETTSPPEQTELPLEAPAPETPKSKQRLEKPIPQKADPVEDYANVLMKQLDRTETRLTIAGVTLLVSLAGNAVLASLILK